MRCLLLLACLLGFRLAAFPQDPVPDPQPEVESAGSEAVRKAKEDLRARIRLLDEIQSNMTEIERLLDQADTSASTQSKQGSAIEKIEQLIELTNKT